MRKLFRQALAGLIFGIAVFGGLALAQVINASLQIAQDPRGVVGVDTNNNLYVTNNRHLLATVNTSPPPVISACTGGTLVAGSTDMSGAVSGTSGTTCTVTFGQAYLTAPRCVTSGSTSSTTTGPVSNSTTTSTLVMTVVATGAGTWSWFCSSNS